MRRTREQFTAMLDAIWECQWIRSEAEKSGQTPVRARDEKWELRVATVDERALEAVLDFIGPVIGDIVARRAPDCRIPFGAP